MKKFAGIGICPPLLGGIELDFTADRSKHCCHFPLSRNRGQSPRFFRDSPRVFSGTVPAFFDQLIGDCPRVPVPTDVRVPLALPALASVRTTVLQYGLPMISMQATRGPSTAFGSTPTRLTQLQAPSRVSLFGCGRVLPVPVPCFSATRQPM